LTVLGEVVVSREQIPLILCWGIRVHISRMKVYLFKPKTLPGALSMEMLRVSLSVELSPKKYPNDLLTRPPGTSMFFVSMILAPI